VALAIALVVATTLGCASATGGSASPVAARDVASLAGKWNGWVRLPTGGSVPGTLEMSPGGDYVVRAGAFSTQGQAQVKDGGVSMVSTGGTGRLAATDRTSAATLAERSDGTRVLRGSGRDEVNGPFDFEFTKPK
jgi:hypothetical protein